LWESAIERLLHHFALQLIIPDQYYGKVSQYVNQHDLRGRIIYQKFNKKAVAPNIFHSSDPDELITKLEFKDSAYTEWVKNEISLKFNYICTDDLETFRLSDKALTSAGQIKNAARHEKDDRPEIKNRQFYILGWDNKEKISVLKEAVTQLNGRISEAEKTITYLQNQETRIRKSTESITSFLSFDTYKKIDWWTLSAQIQENTSRIAELQETNDRVKTLKEQMEGLVQSIAVLTGELDTTKDNLRALEASIGQQQQKLRDAINTLNTYEGMAVEEQLSRFERQFIQDVEVNIENIDGLRTRRQQKLGDDIGNLKDRLRELESEAEGLMRAFIQPERYLVDQFEDWNADTHRLRDRAEFIDEYLATLTRLEEQELVEYKLQFKKYLNEEMITKMSDFQTWLEMQEEEIDGNIETLNGSLEKISFKSNPPTFIQLDSEKDYSPKVKLFKSQLNDWKPNLVEFERTKDDNILEQSFNKIKSTLDYLAQDENMRKEVLDVRNWLKFKAVEHHREDPSKIFRSYTGTAKLSGGESAQLTYTILGSAIAYQFGIHSEGLNTNSFRFICVDEAFSKQDDEKARFLMELCKQLHLQVMVVSPAKAEEVAIVEPYIARVHFVQRKDNRHSVLYDMPIKQLQEHREQYLQTVD